MPILFLSYQSEFLTVQTQNYCLFSGEDERFILGSVTWLSMRFRSKSTPNSFEQTPDNS